VLIWVLRVIEKCANVVDKERIELFSDLLLVGKFQGTIKRDPEIDIRT
jgi:hypothetical protein